MLLKFIKSKKLRIDLSKNSRKVLLKYFDVKNTANKILSILN